MTPPIVRGHATGPAGRAVPDLVARLRSELGPQPPVALLYFASAGYDPDDLAGPLTRAFPTSAVIGCSTAGEFTDEVNGTGGISAIAFPEGVLRTAVAELGDLTTDPTAGTQNAVDRIERRIGTQLRHLDPDRYVGLLLVDGLHGSEEVVNDTLGNAAPLLDFVGGSAGDDLAFARTWVAVGEKVSDHGVALLLLQPAVPHRVMKTCSLRPSGRTLRITAADIEGRLVTSIDGRPATEAYAEAAGVPVADLDTSVWMRNPLGLMIDGQPWVRSPQTRVGNGIRFYAQLRPGMQVEMMCPGDVVADTREAVARVRTELGGTVRGAVLFNCILRRLEMDEERTGDAFVGALRGIPTAGFHTYGESWLGHVNQTLTGVAFG
jgi:hypothetical protein